MANRYMSRYIVGMMPYVDMYREVHVACKACWLPLADVQMEGMVTDLQLAKEKQQQFDDWLSNHSKKVGSIWACTMCVQTGCCV